jgi:phosphohistidine phosphatase
MDLILWRHAFARRLPDVEPGDSGHAPEDDLARELTAKGHAQAKTAAKWLRLHMGSSTRVLCSPALRCQQTAAYLDVRVRVCDALSPSSDAAAILQAVRWPHARLPVLVVGHQPALGQLLSTLLSCPEGALPVKKAGIWWLRHRIRDGVGQTTVHAVVPPDSLHS